MPPIDPAQKELENEVDDVDRSIDRLRATYEQYFLGIERQEPSDSRAALKRRVLALRTVTTRNTGLRFRINQLVAKFGSYENYWNRVTRQMEEGTYSRDLFKARYHIKEREAKKKKEAGEQPADEPAAAAAPRPAAARSAEAGAGGSMSGDRLESIYNAYLLAKRRCKEDTKGLTRETLGATLSRQIPTILKKYKCKSVEFKVVIKGGKAILKAIPKE